MGHFDYLHSPHVKQGVHTIRRMRVSTALKKKPRVLWQCEHRLRALLRCLGRSIQVLATWTGRGGFGTFRSTSCFTIRSSSLAALFVFDLLGVTTGQAAAPRAQVAMRVDAAYPAAERHPMLRCAARSEPSQAWLPPRPWPSVRTEV